MQNFALVSLGAICTGQNTWWNGGAYKIIDGDQATYSMGEYPAVQQGWVKVDTNASPYIRQIRFKQHTSSNNQAWTYRIETSDDNLDWATLEDHTAAGYDELFEIVGTQARYWRFTPLTGGPYDWYMYAIELWGDAAPPDPLSCQYDQFMDSWSTEFGQIIAAWVADHPGSPTDVWWMWIMAALIDIRCIAYLAYDKAALAYNILNGGSGVDLQPVLDAISNLDGDLQSGITVIATNDNANTAAIRGNPVTDLRSILDTMISSLAQQTIDIQGPLGTTVDDVMAAVDDVDGDLQSGITVIAANDNANTAAIRGDPPTDLRSLTTTMTTSFSTQTDELRGVNDLDHTDLGASIQNVKDIADDILSAVQALPSNSGALRLWPGNTGVTYGTPVVVTQPTEINAVCHGVLVTVNAYPAGQSRMPAGSATRFKGIGWVAFRTDLGDYEALEQIQFAEAVIVTRQLEQAAGMAVYCKAGASLTVTPFVIDAL